MLPAQWTMVSAKVAGCCLHRQALIPQTITPKLRLSRKLGRAVPPAAALHELDVAASAPQLEAIHHLVANASPDVALARLLHIADAAMAEAPAAAPQDNGWLAPLVEGLETVLRYIQTGLDKVSVPYSYGWSIVALTAMVKLVTFPLTRTQVESTMSMQQLKPQIDAIKAKYGENKDAVQRETAALYEKAGVNPLAGCLPTLATIPIFIGLYRSLTAVAATGDLDNEGFYWIPSLAGPTSIAAQKAGAGTAWLYPFVDGAPPIGWDGALRYLALPAALVVAQYISSAIISPPVDPNAENAKVQKALYLALPLMVGWFALNLPAGLSLYYFSNTVMTSGQQIFLRKLGGANIGEFDLGPIELGKARRTGTLASTEATSSADEAILAAADAADVTNGAQSNGAGTSPSQAHATVAFEGGAAGGDVLGSSVVPAVATISRRCKRKKRELLEA